MTMNINMSTDLRHLLNESGEVGESSPEPARKLANYLGGIVASVSANRELYCTEHIQCRRYIAKKKCKGKIMAFIEGKKPDGEITWCCENCGQGGVVFGWQGSCFDRSDIRKLSELEYQRVGVWIEGVRLDDVGLPLNLARSSIRRFLAPQDIHASALDSGEVVVTLPALLAIELFVRGILKEPEEPVSLKVGATEASEYKLGTVRYLDRQFNDSVEIIFSPYRLSPFLS